jgi:hypothetical protein
MKESCIRYWVSGEYEDDVEDGRKYDHHEHELEILVCAESA